MDMKINGDCLFYDSHLEDICSFIKVLLLTSCGLD